MSFRRGKTLLLVCCTTLALAALPALVLAQAPASIFQLNGDPTSNGSQCTYGATTATCDSWNLINGTGASGKGVGHSALNTFISGSTNTFNFSTGGSKDANPISNWAYSSTSTPNKDTLNAAYAAVYTISDFDVVFGADRVSPNGDANIGVWFFQENITLNNGKFTGTHLNGDLFVVSAFTSGGGTSTISVYEWDSACTSGVKNPKVGQCADANLRLLANPSSVCGTSDYCAITNSGTVTATWASYSKNSLVTPLFFEGGVDITNAFKAVGGNLPCFASFLVETRSSASTGAVLKDFLLDRFPVCAMSISKQCGTPSFNNGSLTFPVNGVVTNTGLGTLYGIQVNDCINGSNNSCNPTLPVTIVNNTAGSTNLGSNTLAAGETGIWNDSSTSTSSSQSDQAYAMAAESSSGQLTLQSTNTALATCTQSINPTVTVSKSCNTALSIGTGLTACDAGPEGSTVTYTVAITNTSSSGEIVDQICDSAYGNIFTAATFTGSPCTAGTAGTVASSGCSALNIAPSAIGTCTFTAVQGANAIVTDTVSASGHSALNASSTFTNSVSNSVTVTSSDAPSTATVTKGLDSTQAGCATVRYTVDVKNTSGYDENLSLAGFNDDQFGSITSLHDYVLGTTCGVDTGAAGLGTLSGSSGAGVLATALTVGGSDYTCKFDAQFCGALKTITEPDGKTTCLGLQHVNKVTATLTGDTGEAVTQSGNTFTVDECFTSFVSSTTP